MINNPHPYTEIAILIRGYICRREASPIFVNARNAQYNTSDLFHQSPQWDTRYLLSLHMERPSTTCSPLLPGSYQQPHPIRRSKCSTLERKPLTISLMRLILSNSVSSSSIWWRMLRKRAISASAI